MAAKQEVSLHDVAIDMPAGPSEVAVLADETANPAYVASDLLSQAEHGVDSQAILFTTSEKLIDAVKEEVEKQLAVLPRKEITEKSLSHSKLILVNTIDEAIDMSNEYAPEHLIIETKDYMQVAERIVNGLCFRNQPHSSYQRICKGLQRSKPGQFHTQDNISGNNT